MMMTDDICMMSPRWPRCYDDPYLWFRFCITCLVYASLDLGCCLGPGWASSHLLRTLLAFWRSCLWPFYMENEWHSTLIGGTKKLQCCRRLSGRECSIAVPSMSTCTFKDFDVLSFAGREPKSMYYVYINTLICISISSVVFWSLCWDVVIRTCISFSMYFMSTWQLFMYSDLPCHLPYCVPYLLCSWVRLLLYSYFETISIFAWLVTTEQPMANGWYMKSLTL